MKDFHIEMNEWADMLQENDIHFMTEEFEGLNNIWTCNEEEEAWKAQLEISKAQAKIRGLKLEIEKQEAMILQAERVIRKYKVVSKEISAAKGKGRPVSDEHRVRIGKKFVSKWVLSLMEILEVKSCQKLEQLISPHSTKSKFNKTTGKFEEVTVVSKASERNLRRWLKGEAIPNYTTFEVLIGTRIDFGKYKGKTLQDIPTKPNSSSLLSLLRFI